MWPAGAIIGPHLVGDACVVFDVASPELITYFPNLNMVSGGSCKTLRGFNCKPSLIGSHVIEIQFTDGQKQIWYIES